MKCRILYLVGQLGPGGLEHSSISSFGPWIVNAIDRKSWYGSFAKLILTSVIFETLVFHCTVFRSP